MNIIIFLCSLLLNITEVGEINPYQEKNIVLENENTILKEKIAELMIVVDRQNLNIKEIIYDNKKVIADLQNEILLLREINNKEEPLIEDSNMSNKKKIVIAILVVTFLTVFLIFKERYN